MFTVWEHHGARKVISESPMMWKALVAWRLNQYTYFNVIGTTIHHDLVLYEWSAFQKCFAVRHLLNATINHVLAWIIESPFLVLFDVEVDRRTGVTLQWVTLPICGYSHSCVFSRCYSRQLAKLPTTRFCRWLGWVSNSWFLLLDLTPTQTDSRSPTW